MDLLNPLAIASTGRCVLASQSSKGDGPFACPDCDEAVVLRRGEINRPHFAHKGQCPGGGGEGALHRSAGLWVKQHITKWKFEDAVTCSRHPRVHTFATASRASTNARCDVGETKYFLDVGVHYGDDLEGAVEIFDSHKTADQRGRDLATVLSRPIIEVRAEDVFAHEDWMLNCYNIWPRVQCTECAALAESEAARRAALAESEAARRAALPPKSTRRPCSECTLWMEKDDMIEVYTPHKQYKLSYVCDGCTVKCAQCPNHSGRSLMLRSKRVLEGFLCDRECVNMEQKSMEDAWTYIHTKWATEVAARNKALTWSGDTARDADWFQTANANRRKAVARMLPEPTRHQPRLSSGRVHWSALQRYFMSKWMQRRAAILTHLNRWIQQMRHEKLIASLPRSEMQLTPTHHAPGAKPKSKSKPAEKMDNASRKRKADTELHQRATLVQMVKDPRLLKQLFPPRQASIDSYFARRA